MPSLPLASRLTRVAPSLTMAVTAKAAELRAKGVDVLSFGAGEPDFDTPEHIKEAARKGLTEGVAKYTSVHGITPLREAVANMMREVHNVEATADNVIVSCGAKHSLFNAIFSMVEEGTEVIVPAPYWVSYPAMVQLAGGTPVTVNTTAESGFVMSADQLRAAITDRTRLVILNTPSNPTGAVYSRADLQAIAEVVLEHNLWVISDDIYRSLVYGTSYESIARLGKDIAARTILVDGVSKTYAMTGWRIGYTTGPPALVKAIAKVQGQSTSGASHIAQVAALAALTSSQDCVAQMRSAFDERRQRMLALLRQIPGVHCPEPKGAFYAFPDVSTYVGRTTPGGDKIASDLELCTYLLEEGKVALVPGSAFGAPGFARLSYACGLPQIEQGIARMATALGKLAD